MRCPATLRCVAPARWRKTGLRPSDRAPAPRDLLVSRHRFRNAVDHAILVGLIRHLRFPGAENDGRRRTICEAESGGVGKVGRYPRLRLLAKNRLHDFENFLNPRMCRFGKNALEIENWFECDLLAQLAHEFG